MVPAVSQPLPTASSKTLSPSNSGFSRFPTRRSRRRHRSTGAAASRWAPGGFPGTARSGPSQRSQRQWKQCWRQR